MKDAFWFRHDSNASRDMKLLKLKALYDFWGIGLYWSVIELLREQDEYKFQSDESGLDMVCSLVSCLDNVRFHNWFNDCLKFNLFKIDNNYFFSESLCRRMTKWEILKANGDKGGRPLKPKPKPKQEPEAEPLDKIDKKKEEYVYSFFYDSELSKCNGDVNYPGFVGWLFGTNINKRPLTKVLKMNDQISFEQFNKYLSKYGHEKIKDTILDLDNYTKKTYSSFNSTLNNWLKR